MKHFALFIFFLLWSDLVIADPLFPNSVVSNNIDFITEDDRNAFYCLRYFGTDKREMPDKRHDQLFSDGVHIFEAWFDDGSTVEITVHPDFGDQHTSAQIADKLTAPLGKLPGFMRERLSHVVVLKGDETAFAEDRAHFFTIYSENMSKRLATKDLEETVFHESVHATMDADVAKDPAWRQAQSDDGVFLTKYGASLPEREDLAETSLFAFTFFQHPERLGSQLRHKIQKLVPNRLTYLEQFFGKSNIVYEKAEALEPCEG